MKLAGRVAMVTGTSPNIGGGIAEGLAAEGAAVACVDLESRNAEECAAALRARGCRALGVVADVTSQTSVEEAVNQDRPPLGPVHVLVNNAVVFDQQGVPTWTSRAGDGSSPSFSTARFSAPRSWPARWSSAGAAARSSTSSRPRAPGPAAKRRLLHGKGGSVELHALGRNGARELRHPRQQPDADGHRSSRVARTRGTLGARAALRCDRRRLRAFRRYVPMQSLPTPTDYGKAVAFLASDDARFMTGADLRVDSGAVARYWAWNPADPGPEPKSEPER